MKNKVRWFLVTILLLLLGAMAWQPTVAQTPGQVYVRETGHWITGEFLRAYQRVSEPILLYGYPITDAFEDATTGLMVQYFQRARFELHPQEPPDQRVKLTPVGSYLYTAGAALVAPDNFPACRIFPETGYQVCYAFLEFFEAKGGLGQFGYPISNFETHDERIVQYFEYARFEWHPEYPSGQRVTLTDMGRRYFDEKKENPLRLLPNQDDAALHTIMSLKVRAFPKHAVTALSGSQTVYVIVQDQNMGPVQNASVTLVYRTPSGEEGRFILPLTDERGVSQFTFTYSSRERGLATISVEVAAHNLQQETVTSFRIWW